MNTTAIHTTCCQAIDALLSETPLPFQKMIILDWYDGPTAGVLVCEQCQTAYQFHLLDWDERHEKRVFALAPLPAGSLSQIIRLFEESPRWPIWFPAQLQAPPQEFRSRLKELDQILEKAGSSELLLVWSNTANQFIAARRLDPALRSQAVDWFTLDDPASAFAWLSYLEQSPA